MPESYGHRIMPIHENADNRCDSCNKPARWETDYQYYGEHATQSSNPGKVCDAHAKVFAEKWPSVTFPPTGSGLS